MRAGCESSSVLLFLELVIYVRIPFAQNDITTLFVDFNIWKDATVVSYRDIT